MLTPQVRSQGSQRRILQGSFRSVEDVQRGRTGSGSGSAAGRGRMLRDELSSPRSLSVFDSPQRVYHADSEHGGWPEQHNAAGVVINLCDGFSEEEERHQRAPPDAEVGGSSAEVVAAAADAALLLASGVPAEGSDRESAASSSSSRVSFSPRNSFAGSVGSSVRSASVSISSSPRRTPRRPRAADEPEEHSSSALPRPLSPPSSAATGSNSPARERECERDSSRPEELPTVQSRAWRQEHPKRLDAFRLPERPARPALPGRGGELGGGGAWRFEDDSPETVGGAAPVRSPPPEEAAGFFPGFFGGGAAAAQPNRAARSVAELLEEAERPTGQVSR